MLLRSWSVTKGHRHVKSLQVECRSLIPLQDSVLERNNSPEPPLRLEISERKQREKVGNYDCLSASSVVCNLPPRFLQRRSYYRDSEPSYLSGPGFVPCTGKKCPAPNWSTKNVHSCPDWCHSLGICSNNVDRPAGKLLGPPQRWVSSPFVQPPDSTVLQQKSEPSAGCLLHPIVPSAVELALLLQRQNHKEMFMSYSSSVFTRYWKFTKILSNIWGLHLQVNLNLPFNHIIPFNEYFIDLKFTTLIIR